MLRPVYDFILQNTAVLYTVLYKSPWFFIDFWSFVHFGSGAILMALFQLRRLRRAFGTLLVLLVGYEFVEIAFAYLAIGIFRPEILTDQVTDVVVGMAGGLAAWICGRKASRRVIPIDDRPELDLILAVSIATVWVALYGYRYNIPELNSAGLSWWAILLWSLGLWGVFRLYVTIRGRMAHPMLAAVLVWFIYLVALFLAEWIGYRWLVIREVRAGEPLAFGLVHGSRLMKFYYAAAPILTLGVRGIIQESRAPVGRTIDVVPGPAGHTEAE